MKKWGLQWGPRLNPPEQIDPSSVLEILLCKQLNNESIKHILFYSMLHFTALTTVCRHTWAWDKYIGNMTWQFSNFISVVRFTDNSHNDKPTEENPDTQHSQSSATLRSAVTAAMWARITPDVQWINMFIYCSFGDWKANQRKAFITESCLTEIFKKIFQNRLRSGQKHFLFFFWTHYSLSSFNFDSGKSVDYFLL